MIDTNILRKLVERYEAGQDTFYGAEHDELYKWRAVRFWQQTWNAPYVNFVDRFASSTRGEVSLLLNIDRMRPDAGILKLYMKEPEKVSHLFCDVLLDPDLNLDLNNTQARFDTFATDMESMRLRYFPSYDSYRQDAHAITVYLGMQAPTRHYIYLASASTLLARHISDQNPHTTWFNYEGLRLAPFYDFCNTVRDALAARSSLVSAMQARLDESCDPDEALHLLTADFMHCCQSYQLYDGLPAPRAMHTTSPEATQQRVQDALLRLQLEVIMQEEPLKQVIATLEARCADCLKIQLVGTPVTSAAFGEGVIVGQEANVIEVQFQYTRKAYVLDRRTPVLPHFENEQEVIDAYTRYARDQEQLRQLTAQLRSIRFMSAQNAQHI